MTDAIDDAITKCLDELGFEKKPVHRHSITGKFEDEDEYVDSTGDIRLLRQIGHTHTGDLSRAIIFEKGRIKAGLTCYPNGRDATRIIYHYKNGNSKLWDLKSITEKNLSPLRNPLQNKHPIPLSQLPVDEVIKVMYNTLAGYTPGQE